MPTLEVAAQNAACDAITALIDVGGAGSCVFETDGDVEVATCPFSAEAFGAAAAGVCTSAAITSDETATGGVIEHVTFNSGTPAKIMECTIDVDSLSDFQISSLTIGAGDTVSIGLGEVTVTVPAS